MRIFVALTVELLTFYGALQIVILLLLSLSLLLLHKKTSEICA